MNQRFTAPPVAMQDGRPSTTLITVTYNSAATLERFWREADLGASTQWVVVDNASTDNTADLAASLGAQVVRLPKNVGFSAANNAGMKVASADFIGFINPDVRITSKNIEILRSVAEEQKALVAPQLLNSDGSIQHNGRGFPLLSSKVRNRLRGDDHNYLLTSEDDNPRPVVWAMGAAILGHRDDFESIGGWDPHFFLYYEDADIGFRAWAAGLRMLLVPAANATHGWARETAGRFRWAPWKRELASMSKFYVRYPALILWPGVAKRRYRPIWQEVFGGKE